MEEYHSFVTSNGEVFYKGELSSLQKADVLIFDMDGTLVDVSKSYDQVAIETVKMLFNVLTGVHLPEDPLRSAIYEIKKVGGFNNEWDVTYTMLMGLLSGLKEEALDTILGLLPEEFGRVKLQDLVHIAVKAGKVDLKDALEGLNDIVDYVDERGVISVDEAIERLYKNRKKRAILFRIKSFLNYPNYTGSSLLTIIFEELYWGEELFSKIYEIPSSLHIKRGFREEERLTIKLDTIRFLKRRFKDKIGLITGRRRIGAELILHDLLESFFNKDATYFLGDFIEEEKDDGSILGKPDPLALRKALSALKPENRALYVGDSMEDLLMVNKLNDEKVEFVGTYSSSYITREYIKGFMESGASAILPTVNELKELLGT